MNKDIVLTSNLLDIIFDGRNKDYGAYILRRDYVIRMRMALLAMSVTAVLFCVIALSKSNKAPVKNTPAFLPVDHALSPYITDKGMLIKPIKTITKKHLTDPLAPPRIIHSDNINKLPATTEIIQQSITGTSDTVIGVPAEISTGSSNGKGLQEASGAPVVAKKDHSAVLYHADVMPEYPGGIKALLEFLKKNIHEPQDAEESEDVAVKVRFIVNYNGNLEGFNVVESGGDAYDNEVLRVLKKMPQWIPGKSNGENVSVYFIVPVHFTKED